MKSSGFWDFISTNVISLLTVLSSVIVIILDQLGLISQNIVSSTILGLLALLATSEIVESRKRLSELDEKIEKLSMQLLNITKGVKTITFSTNADALEYAGKRMREVTKSVDMASIDQRRSTKTPSLKKYYSGREKAILSNDVKFRYLVILYNERRLNYAWEYLQNPRVYSFFVGFYTEKLEIPQITFTIFDREEVFTRYPFQYGTDEGYISIRSPEVVELFLGYYERLWENSQKLITEEDYERAKAQILN